MVRNGLSRRALAGLGVAFLAYMAFTLALNLAHATRVREVVYRTWIAHLDELGALPRCDAAPEAFTLPHHGVASLVPVDAHGQPFQAALPAAPGWPDDLQPGEVRGLAGDWADARWIAAMDTGRAGRCRYFLLYGLSTNFLSPAETALNLSLRLGAILGLLLAIWTLAIRPLVRRVHDMAAATSRIVEADFHGALPTEGADELTELAAAFNDAAAAARDRLDQLLERDRLTRQVVADIAHDVRTPLSALKLATSRALADRAAGPNDAIFLSELSYLDALIGNLTSLAQLKGAHLPELRRQADLGALTARVVARFRLLARARGVELHEALPGVPLELCCDPLAVEQALANLVHNAVEFARANTAVLCYEADGQAVLEVRDDGPGVAVAELGRLRERYFRGGGEVAAGRRGQGLGLAIADEVARRHGGTLSIGPLPEGGTLAAIRLGLNDARGADGTHADRA